MDTNGHIMWNQKKLVQVTFDKTYLLAISAPGWRKSWCDTHRKCMQLPLKDSNQQKLPRGSEQRLCIIIIIIIIIFIFFFKQDSPHSPKYFSTQSLPLGNFSVGLAVMQAVILMEHTLHQLGRLKTLSIVGQPTYQLVQDFVRQLSHPTNAQRRYIYIYILYYIYTLNMSYVICIFIFMSYVYLSLFNIIYLHHFTLFFLGGKNAHKPHVLHWFSMSGCLDAHTNLQGLESAGTTHYSIISACLRCLSSLASSNSTKKSIGIGFFWKSSLTKQNNPKFLETMEIQRAS